MCGRYHMGDDTLEAAIEELDAMGMDTAGMRDVCPAQQAPVLYRPPKTGIRTGMMKWGFPQKNSGLLINARAETALQKPTFSESMLQRRCLLPADAFYEWDKEGTMVTFTVPDRRVFYLAGCFDLYASDLRFVVLTTQANTSMAPVHDRMPVIFDGEQAREWLQEGAAVADMLQIKMPELAGKAPFRQTSFLDQ